MFERYTEKARRVVFFAKYEARQAGSPNIESEHLLLGVMRESPWVLSLLSGGLQQFEAIASELRVKKFGEQFPADAALPLSTECKRILVHAATESQRLSHKHIGTEHLFLGVLLEKECAAAQVLQRNGVAIKQVRAAIITSAAEAARKSRAMLEKAEKEISGEGSEGPEPHSSDVPFNPTTAAGCSINQVALIGKNLGPYRILKQLGQGGMGVVYLAEDTRLARHVAIKVLPEAVAADQARKRRFEQEARSAAALNHQAIATIHAYEEHSGRLCIVMEYVAGETLRGSVLAGAMPAADVAQLGAEIARGLAAAHDRGIVHRDLKPENVMRTPSGEVKILDFGLARQQEPQGLDAATRSLGITDPGSIVGTIAYMSPEQLEAKEPDPRSDIFALGVMLYELASGVHPFTGSSAASTIANVLTQEPESLCSRDPLNPPELDRIVCKCLRKRREQRYHSAADLAADLEELARALRSGLSRPEQNVFAADASLFSGLRRFLPTPRRWWELNLLFTIAVYMAIPFGAWGLRRADSYPWATAEFVLFLVATAALMCLRVILFEVAIVSPGQLADRVHTFARPIRAFTCIHGALLIVMATEIGLRDYPILAPSIIAIGVAVFFYAFAFESLIERTAFPRRVKSSSTEEAGGPTGMTRGKLCRRMALLQALLTLPNAAFLLYGMQRMLAKRYSIDEMPLQLVLGLILLAAALVGESAAMRMWQGAEKDLQRFLRLLRLFSVLDSVWFLPILFSGAFKAPAIFVATLVALTVTGFIPRYQARLARQALAIPAIVEPMKEDSRAAAAE